MNLTAKFFTLFFLVLNFAGQAQDPSFSQCEPVLSYNNPSYNDFHKQVEVVLLHRNQWQRPQLFGFKTYFLSANYNNAKYNFGFGFSYSNDKEGIHLLETTNLRGSGRWGTKLGSNTSITFGVYAGYHLKQFSADKLYFSNQLDPYTGITRFSDNIIFSDPKDKFDAGFGVTFSAAGEDVSVPLFNDLSLTTAHFVMGYSISHLYSKESNLLNSGTSPYLNPLHSVAISYTIVPNSYAYWLYNINVKYDLQTPIKSSINTAFKKGLSRLVFGSYFGYGLGYGNNGTLFTGLFHASNIRLKKENNTRGIILLVGSEFEMFKKSTVTLTLSRDMNYRGFAAERTANDTVGAWEVSLVIGWAGKDSFGKKLKSNIFKTSEPVCSAYRIH